MARHEYHKELEGLKADVLELHRLADGMLQDAVKSLLDLDEALAEDVISRKGRLAEMDEAIEHRALQLVMLQQPMAGDMRAIGAALKMITYLNRLGRYGKDIAQITSKWEGEHWWVKDRIAEMADHVGQMQSAALEAYETEEPFDLDRFTEWEDRVDQDRWGVFDACLPWMMKDPRHVPRGAEYLMIARYLERCGDNICKIAEKVHYMITGDRITIR